MTSQSRSERSQINVRFTLTRNPDSAAADVRDKVSRVRGQAARRGRRAGDREGRGRFAAGHLHRRRRRAADAARGLRLRHALHQAAPVGAARRGGRAHLRRAPGVDAHQPRPHAARRLPADRAGRRGRDPPPERRDPGRPHRIDGARVHRRRRDRRARRPSSSATSSSPTSAAIRCASATSGTVGDRRARRARRSRATTASPRSTSASSSRRSPTRSSCRRAVRAEVDKINENLPPGMKLVVAYDTSVFIDRSITSVFETIAEAILLVVLVIFFFLRSLRATIIPIVTIPVSLIGAFALMYAVRLHDQHADAARDGAGDRPRRRRRDRRAGEHLPAHRGGHAAQGRRRSRARARSPSRSSR